MPGVIAPKLLQSWPALQPWLECSQGVASGPQPTKELGTEISTSSGRIIARAESHRCVTRRDSRRASRPPPSPRPTTTDLAAECEENYARHIAGHVEHFGVRGGAGQARPGQRRPGWR